MNNFLSKPRVIVATIIGLIIVLSIFLVYQQNSPQPTNKREKVVIAQTSDFFLYAPIYIAIDAGYFSNENLDVQLISTGGDEKTWAAVLSGSAQFGVSDPTFVAISAQHGKPGTIVANIVNGVPFWGVTFRNDIDPIKSSKSLEGYSVATFPSPSTAYSLQKKMYMDAGLSPDIKEAGFGTILAILKAGKADIGLELEPNVSRAESEGAKILYSFSKIYGDFAITGLSTSNETVLNRPELVGKTVRAIQRSLNLIHSDPDSCLELLNRRFPEISKTIAKSAFTRVVADKIIPLTCITDSIAWSRAISLRIAIGDLKEISPMSIFVNNHFANSAIINK